MSDLLVGRDRELGAIGEALGRAAAGHVLAVTGEPGIGKSRLLAELATLTTARGGLVCAGWASELDRRLPYGVLADALDDHLSPRSGWTSAWSSMTAAVHFSETVRALPRPVCLLLDDLQWIDPGSQQLLEHLVENPAPGVLIALGYRDRQVPAGLDAAVRRAVAAGAGLRLELGPLSAGDVAALAGGTDAARLHQLSGGNPSYVEALLRSPDPDAELPAEVQAALEREFAALVGLDRRVLQASAVAGEDFDAELVAAIAGLGPAETRATLDRLAARDLLRGTPDRYRYRHPLLRTAAYATAGPGWRLAAHGRAAAALADRGAPAAARARHVERAAAPGDDAAVAVLTAAAGESATVEPDRSARWLAVALTLLPDRPEWTQLRVGLNLWRARLLGNAGRLQESRDLLHVVLSELPAGSGEQRAHAVVRCTMAERLLGRHAEAQALVSAELAGCAPGRAFVELYLELSASRAMAAVPDASRWPKVLLVARSLGDELLLAGALALRCLGELHGGAVDLAGLDEAAALLDPLTDTRLMRGLDMLTWLGWAEAHTDRLAAADRHLSRALRLARAGRQLHLLPQVLCVLGMVRGWQGRLDNAEACLTIAAKAARHTGSHELKLLAVAHRHEILSLRRKPDSTLPDEQNLAGPSRLVAGATLARTRLLAGDPESTIHLLHSLAGGPALPAFAPHTRIPHLALLTEAHATGPDADAAAAVAGLLAARLNLPSSIGFARLARAFVVAPRDPAVAAQHALQAAEFFARSGHRVQEGRARLLAAAFGAEGDPHRAAAQLDRAESLLAAADARVYLEQVHRERRRLGHTATLTDREREIARLVAKGHPNRMIAAALFISGRTVEGHLTRIYTKLGVSSRAAVAALFAAD
jgi:DNA-binding CsgD family transcriptional regulator